MLGLGRFGGGLGAARWLIAEGADVTVTDRSPRETLAEPAAELEGLGARLVLGGHEGLDPSRFDLIVVNPAVPLDAPLVRAARAAGRTVTSEIALLIERWPGPVLGVTGSNGKSTTVALCRQLLTGCGQRALAGGNLGGSLLARLGEVDARTVAVLELSSFMLEVLGPAGLGPDVAVITNLTANHLDRHGTFEAYREAKAAILARCRLAVLAASDPAVAGLAARASGGIAWFFDGQDDRRPDGAPGGPQTAELRVDERGDLVAGDGSLVVAGESLPLPGRMNALDLAAAVLAVEAFVPDVRSRILPALSGWRTLPHRLETVVERNGVRWIDDSVSTTPESTAASLAAVDRPCLLIAGGRDKGLDVVPLVRAARGRVRRVLTVGEEAGRLAAALNLEGVPAEQVDTVAAAVLRAASLARPGDAVLLSPGFSSHDQFAHFEERAAFFRRCVGALPPISESLSCPRGEC